MIAVSQLSYLAYTDVPVTGSQTTWSMGSFIPNGALSSTHIEYRLQYTGGAVSQWQVVTGWDDVALVATQLITFDGLISQVHLRRNTPRYSVYLDPLVPSSRVSQNNLQVNADQGLFTAVEWAARYGIDAYAPMPPPPGTTPNTLGLQQQTQNYFGPDADYTPRVWNFQFAGGYMERAHVRVMALVNGEWTQLEVSDGIIDPEQFLLEVREDSLNDFSGFDLDEDGAFAQREGVVYPNDADTSPIRFVGDYQLYMDFGALPALPTSLVIYRYTPRDVRVSSLYDKAVITADGMAPSTLHAFFVATELGEVLAQYAPPCDCLIGTLSSIEWKIHGDLGIHNFVSSVTLTGEPNIIYGVDLRITGSYEGRQYNNGWVAMGGNGHFGTALSDQGLPANYNIYSLAISDPPQLYYINWAPEGEVMTLITPDGSPAYTLSLRIRGNGTITATSVDVLNDTPSLQFGTCVAEITGIGE